MVTSLEWVILTYRLPREPSTPRIAVWRRLRRLGAIQLADGVVALPADARTREQLEWVADDVSEAGGEASVWLARPTSREQDRALAARMAAGVGQEYRAVIAAARRMAPEADHVRQRTLGRLRRELRRIGLRDFFPPPERSQARAAVQGLARAMEPVG